MIKCREISGLLGNRWIFMKNRVHIYAACIRLVLLYGAVSWPLTQHLEQRIQSCDRQMVQFLSVSHMKEVGGGKGT